MKRLLIGDHRTDLLGTLEIILKHWGYRVLVTSRLQEFRELLLCSEPDFVVIGNVMLADGGASLETCLQQQIERTANPLVLLKDAHVSSCPSPRVELEVPVDIFKFFELVQEHLEKHPRRNLRLEVSLPGMVCRDQASELAEVLSISTHGLFIKTTYRLEPRDTFQVIFPLLGMHRELELAGRVLYRMDPGPENNYRQGVGLEFTQMSEENRRQLENFLEHRLLNELTEGKRGAEIDLGTLRSRTLPPTSQPDC